MPDEPMTEAEIAEQAAKEVQDRKEGKHCFHPWGGANMELEARVKPNLKDPDSYEHIESLLSFTAKYWGFLCTITPKLHTL